MTLEQIIAKAKQAANNKGDAVAVLNLNPVGAPMYVVRDISSEQVRSRAVAIVEPDAPADPFRAFVEQIARMSLPGETGDGWPDAEDEANTIAGLVMKARELTS